MSKKLTQRRMKERLHYDPETGIFTWRLDQPSCGLAAGDVAGSTSIVDGYHRIGVDGDSQRQAHRLAFLYMTGAMPPEGVDVDHMNGVRNDNRWANLRQLSRSENMQNLQAPHADNKSGFLGVAPARERFAAYIRANKKNKYLGTFDTPQEAHAAYVAAKRVLHAGNML